MANELRRQPCAYCGRERRWPDLCREADDPMCADFIHDACQDFDDHRRCEPATCEFAAQWCERVKAAGVEAATAAGADYAVISVLDDQLAVCGTGSHLGRVKSLVRTRALKAAGYDPVADEGKGLVYVVRRDGWLM